MLPNVGADAHRRGVRQCSFTKALILAIVLATPLALLGQQAPASASVSVEMRIHELIDADRAEPLTIHYGLQAAAREHSRYMASRGSLSHENADARVNSAPPDPAEGDGAPDNGFPVAAWCENVTYSVGRSEAEAPGQLYAQWKRSGAHYRCLMDTSRNVGAVGIYYDGQSWWATFIAEVDETPPGGGTRTKPKPAETKPTPEARAAPASTGEPESEPKVENDDAQDDDVAPPPESSPTNAVGASAAPTSESDSRTTAEPSRAPHAEEPDAAAVDDRPVAAEDAPFAGAVHRATAPSDPPLAIGWQEVLGVAGVLSVASFLLKRRWVVAPT
jgi:hypothetical protein